MMRSQSVLLFSVVLLGCGQSREQAMLDKYYPDRDPVFPVAGVVTIDGQPGQELFLRLVPADAAAPSSSDPQTFTDGQGKFEFSTYLQGDGVPAGSYRLLVEKLVNRGSQGREAWGGPDGLKNLFNHLGSPAEQIEVSKGQKNLEVRLEVADKSPKKTPSYGVTAVGNQMGRRR
jgi:hypothetical protein